MRVLHAFLVHLDGEKLFWITPGDDSLSWGLTLDGMGDLVEGNWHDTFADEEEKSRPSHIAYWCGVNGDVLHVYEANDPNSQVMIVDAVGVRDLYGIDAGYSPFAEDRLHEDYPEDGYGESPWPPEDEPHWLLPYED